MKRILILSFEFDYHAQAIRALLQKMGHDADLLDTSQFPASIELIHRGRCFDDVRLNGTLLANYHAVWWRRVKLPVPSLEVEIPEERRFAAAECRDALWGALQAAGRPTYNDPEKEQTADRKPYQLKLACEEGLFIPDTLITTSAAEVKEFQARHREVIFKPFGSTDLAHTDTRPLAPEDLDHLWRLKYAPAIFQEYIALGRDLRATIIEEDIFAAEIQITKPGASYDWRNDLEYLAKPVELPEEIKTGLRRLRQKLGLSSGSADFRQSPDGKIYFLEMNPSGQFLFLDIRAGLDVAPRFCSMLLQ